MVKHLETAVQKVVGLKQVIKEAQIGNVDRVYIAKNAEEHLKEKILDALDGKPAQIIEVDTMDELGSICGIKVGSACAAILKEDCS